MGSFSIWHWLIVLVIVMLISAPRSCATWARISRRGARFPKDGMREGDKAADAGPAPQVTGKTIEGEVKEKTEQKA